MDGQTNRKIIGNKLRRKLKEYSYQRRTQAVAILAEPTARRVQVPKTAPFVDYILDFACLDRKVVIELDGGQHADNLQYDNARTNYLERCGFQVLRFWNNEVFDNIEGVAEVILNTLAQRATPSPPNPPLEGED